MGFSVLLSQLHHFPAAALSPTCFRGKPSLLRLSSPTSMSISSPILLPSFNGGRARTVMALIGPESGRALFCVTAACAAFGQVMETKTKLGAQVSAPLLALLVGMVLSGAQIIPSTSPLYDFIFTSIMPMAVGLCLLETDVQSIFSDSGSTLKAFWYGALGTIIGTLVSFKIIGSAMGPDGWKIASSLCSSYIGGTINYVATAQALGLTSASTLAAGMAADNLAMAAYFAMIMAIPDSSHDATPGGTYEDSSSELSKVPTVETLSISLAAAAGACTIGNSVASLLPASLAGCGLAITALIASCFSAAAGQVHRGANIQVFAGSQALGSSLMLLYFSVIGASAGFRDALLGGWPLFTFIIVLVLVHLGVILSLGGWSKLPISTVLVASNANIGGPATAAAMAQCRGWKHLVKPAVLLGTLGYMIGTTIGCLIGVHFLRPLI